MHNVTHHPDRFVFQITGKDGQEPAHLDYELLDQHSVNFTHTYVPFRQRGQGHAEALVKAGLEWAKANQLAIQTRCWYVEKYMAEHTK